jgi:hypothetical protein
MPTSMARRHTRQPSRGLPWTPTARRDRNSQLADLLPATGSQIHEHVIRHDRRKKSEFLMVIMAAATPPTENSRYVQPVEADDRSQRPFIQ